MRNEATWHPSKFVRKAGRWRGSRDPSEVNPASRIICDLLAAAYDAMIRNHARGRLVDLGCGKAPLYGMYRPLVDEVTCVDWELGTHGNTHVDHAMDLNRPFALPDEGFDTVLTTDVLEHIRDHGLFWTEMARICRPKGKILLGTPFLYPLHEVPHDYARHTEYSLRAACAENGLEVIEITPYGGGPEVISDLILKQFGGAETVIGGVHPLLSAMLRLPLVRRRSQSTRRIFPLGYCVVAAKP